MLMRQVLYHLSHTSSSFRFDYFGDRVLLFAQGSLEYDPQFYPSHCGYDDRYVPLCPTTGWDRVLRTFCLGWSQTTGLSISIFQVAKIIGMSYWCLATMTFFFFTYFNVL
jgi:hypothetical protein